MDEKVNVAGAGWMTFMFILSLIFGLSGELLPVIVVIIWMICPFVTRICDFDSTVMLIPNLIFSIICASSMFGDTFIIAALEAFISFAASTGYVDFVYNLIDGIINKKRRSLEENIKNRIREREVFYLKIEDMLSVIETNSDEEKIVQLLSRCCATSLREEYIKRQNEKNIELLKMAKELNSQHKLRLNFQDKSISEIRSDVKKEIDALHDYEENISKYGMYELKHYTI